MSRGCFEGKSEFYQAGSEGPQRWVPWSDKVRGLPARGILDRCTASKTCPKINPVTAASTRGRSSTKLIALYA